MIGCIIQARVGSTRLPGKTLKSVNVRDSVLSFGIKQIKNCNLIDKLVVASTTLPEDDKLINYVEKLNTPCFRGSSNDVLDRYYQCAKKFSFSTIVRITSDCPLIDPEIVDHVILNFIKNKDSFDYVSNLHPTRTFPHGADVEVFSFEALEIAWKEAKKSYDREHVTPYLYNNQKFKILNITNEKNLSHLRWTVDYKEDLELIQEIISGINKRPILMNDILLLLSKKPHLIDINKNVPQNH